MSLSRSDRSNRQFAAKTREKSRLCDELDDLSSLTQRHGLVEHPTGVLPKLRDGAFITRAAAHGRSERNSVGGIQLKSKPVIVPVLEAKRSVSTPNRCKIDTNRFGNG